MKTEELLSLLDGVQRRGNGKWSAKCSAHNDRSPSLSVSEGDKGILLKCWAGCSLQAITAKLGLSLSDLFFEGLPDPRQRQALMHRRAHARMAQEAASREIGLRMDALREAESLVASANGFSIDRWTDAQLDVALDRLAAAYHCLESEVA